MGFVLGFICGSLLPWVIYRMIKVLKDHNDFVREVWEEAFEEIIKEHEEELNEENIQNEE